MPTTLDLLRALVDAARELGGLLETLDEGGEPTRTNRGVWKRIGIAARNIHMAAENLAQEEELRGQRAGRGRASARPGPGPRRGPQSGDAGSDLGLFRMIRAVAKYRGMTTASAMREAIGYYVTLFGPWPAFVFRENRAFTIQFANQAALDLLGYKLEELFGQSMCEIYDEYTQERVEIRSNFMQAGGVRNVPVGIRKKSGETRPMRLFAQREVKPLGIPRIYAAWRDV
jgi:PAS domain S-box-containing protein